MASLNAQPVLLPVPAPTPVNETNRRSQLWLGLCFPGLPVRAVSTDTNVDSLLAVYQPHHQNSPIIAFSQFAAEHGIVTGMTLKEAWTICPQLTTIARDSEREQELLHDLANSLTAFSSAITLDGSNTIILEIAGSLNLFGGIRSISTRIQAVIKPFADFDYGWAITPTPRAAALGAQAGINCPIKSNAALRSDLGSIGVDHLKLDKTTARTLSRMGVRTLKQLWRLPRSGLHKRFGSELVIQIEQLLGERPDPRIPYHSPRQFRYREDLEEESIQEEHIGQVMAELCRRLQADLVRHNSVTNRIEWVLRLLDHPLHFTLRPGEATCNAEHLFQLSLLRLQRIDLTSPVRSVSLRCHDILANPGGTRELFNAHGALLNEDYRTFMARMRSRLGREAVHGLDLADEYRPEKSWRLCLPGTAENTETSFNSRPAWILNTPMLLKQHNDAPCLNGPLTLDAEYERIVSGWWDQHPVTRDYHCALTTRGQRLWVFRDLKTRQWYLHGIY